MLEALALTFGNFIKGISQLKVKSAKLKVESGGRKSDGLKLITLTNPRNNSETTFYFPLYTFNYSDTGLMYFGARFYDPQLGRFITEDPAGPMKDRPMTLNRYNYVLNNPMIYVDPDGRFFMEIGTFIGGILGAGAALISGGDVAEGWKAGVKIGGSIGIGADVITGWGMSTWSSQGISGAAWTTYSMAWRGVAGSGTSFDLPGGSGGPDRGVNYSQLNSSINQMQLNHNVEMNSYLWKNYGLMGYVDMGSEALFYGNNCGPFWTNEQAFGVGKSRPPVDQMDCACKEHDEAYGAVGANMFTRYMGTPGQQSAVRQADRQLIDGLNKVPDSELGWYGRIYKHTGSWIFRHIN